MKRLRQQSLIWWMFVGMIACGILLIISASAYLEAVDPCTKWEDRGTNVYMFGGIRDGGTAIVRPNRVCVARKSGWHE